jgi:hypothetical protein
MMLVRVPPGGAGVPIGELLVIFVLLTIHYPSTAPRLGAIFPVPLLVCWWCYIFFRAFSGVSEHGLWALRDATNVIESLFLLGGFAFARNPENIEKLFRWLPKLLIVACIYGLTYPFGHFVQAISPKIISGSGQLVSLVGMYTNTSVMLLWAAFYIMIFMTEQRTKKVQKYSIAVSLVGFTLILFQARTIYLQILAIFFLFLFYKKDLTGKGIVAVILCLFLVSLLPLFGAKITGRIGQEVSIDFFFKHFMAIFGIAGEGVEQAAQGVSLRTDWWSSIYFRLISSWSNLLTGLGYGFPLVNFHVTGGVPVREPHNSYISFVARSGLIGVTFFLWIHFKLLRVWQETYKQCKRLSWEQGANRLLILLIYFVLILVFAIGEDAFEKPFNAIPYYFFWGIILRFAYHLKHGNIGPYQDKNANTY